MFIDFLRDFIEFLKDCWPFLLIAIAGVTVLSFTNQKQINKPENKKCFNHCPKCGAGESDITWGDKDWGNTSAWQNATCNKCQCMFTEIYEYTSSEIDDVD
jgi:hypothetical protein